jgi:hypothetical protein
MPPAGTGEQEQRDKLSRVCRSWWPIGVTIWVLPGPVASGAVGQPGRAMTGRVSGKVVVVTSAASGSVRPPPAAGARGWRGRPAHLRFSDPAGKLEADSSMFVCRGRRGQDRTSAGPRSLT